MAAPPSVDAATGGIEGTITNDEGLPLPAADVGIPKLNKFTTADKAGRFSLSHVEPGDHTLFVSLLGHEPASRPVRVTAGEVTRVVVALMPKAVPTPHALTTIHEGFIDCGYGFLTSMGSLACDFADANHKVKFTFDATAEVEAVLGELVWQPGAALAAQSLRLTLRKSGGTECSGVCSPQGQYGDVRGSSPVVVRAEAPYAGLAFDAATGRATLVWEVWVPGREEAGAPVPVLVFKQPFTLYQTVFHGMKPEDGFSAVSP